MNPKGRLDTESNLLDNRDLLSHAAAGKGKTVLVIHRALLSELISLVHTTHGDPAWLLLLHWYADAFIGQQMKLDVREYVLPYGYRRRTRSFSQRITMLLGNATQPWARLI